MPGPGPLGPAAQPPQGRPGRAAGRKTRDDVTHYSMMGPMGGIGSASAQPPQALSYRRPGQAAERRRGSSPGQGLSHLNHQAKLNRRGTRARRTFNQVPRFNHGPLKLLVDSDSRRIMFLMVGVLMVSGPMIKVS